MYLIKCSFKSAPIIDLFTDIQRGCPIVERKACILEGFKTKTTDQATNYSK